MIDRPNVEPPVQQLLEPAVQTLLKIPGIPTSWNFYLLSVGAMLALAGLATFGVLFAVYAASLKVAELSVVTFGWIIFLQVGIVLLDTLHYGVRLPPGKWVAIAGLFLLQAYLILAPNSEAGGTTR